MVPISAPTDWTTDLGEFRAISVSGDTGAHPITMTVMRRQDNGTWRRVTLLTFGPEDNSILGFDEWRVAHTGYIPGKGAYPAWVHKYGDTSDLSGDERAVFAEVMRVGLADSGEISDGCARTITSWATVGDSTPGYAFTSTGAITTDDPSDLWHELGGAEYTSRPGWHRDALGCLGTYLMHRADRGPVAGWSTLWVR